MDSYPYKKLGNYFPLLFRYFFRIASLHFVLVFIAFTLFLIFATIVFYLNQAKVFSFFIAFEYVISTLGISFQFIFPLIIALSFYLTARFFFKIRFHIVLASLGLSLKTFLPLIGLIAFVNSLLTFVYFEIFYPEAAYINYTSYLKSKNKLPQAGLIKHFFYKNNKNQFVYFQIVSLVDKKALGGKVFKLNNNFSFVWVDNVPKATISLSERTLTIKAGNVTRYQTDRVIELKNYTLTIPYQEKLLKVKMPKFFSLTELIGILNYAKRFGLNTTIYLWELEKRILLIIFIFTVSIYSFLTFFGNISTASKKEDSNEILKVVAFIFSFYLLIIFYQVLVNKISLNPLYGLAIIAPYLGILIGKWKTI